MSRFTCLVCRDGELLEVPGYESLPRVSGDSVPYPAGGALMVCGDCGTVQKRRDEQWQREAERIYRGYSHYELSGGAEQVIFDPSGGAAPRSRTLADFILGQAKLPETGKLLDIGCGNGAALATFSAALPSWDLYGSELTDSALPRLRAIRNFRELYTVLPHQIENRFDLVTSLHTLGYLPDPIQMMQGIHGLLNEDGRLFVATPNLETTPFDIVILEQTAHFTAAHLAFLVNRAGFDVEVLRADVLPKELTMVARRGAQAARKPDARRSLAVVEAHVAWLFDVIEKARETAARSPRFGLFGTATSAMWLYGAMEDRVSFFVDEDRSRVGKTHEGRPIVAPSDVPSGAAVFVPLVPQTAENVVRRLGGKTAMVPPPAYPELRTAA